MPVFPTLTRGRARPVAVPAGGPGKAERLRPAARPLHVPLPLSPEGRADAVVTVRCLTLVVCPRCLAPPPSPADAVTLLFFAGFLIRLEDIPPWWYWYSIIDFARCVSQAARTRRDIRRSSSTCARSVPPRRPHANPSTHMPHTASDHQPISVPGALAARGRCSPPRSWDVRCALGNTSRATLFAGAPALCEPPRRQPRQHPPQHPLAVWAVFAGTTTR